MKITRLQTLQRTKAMLKERWKLNEEPLSDTSLRPAPPAGLGKNDNQIRALEGPIETKYFLDVGAQVTGSDLAGATTVGTLRNVIWDGIPAANQN